MEPTWLNRTDLFAEQLSDGMQSWLLKTPSPTKRLRQKFEDGFRVNLLSQDWQQPRFSEAQMLGIDVNEQVMVREVELLANNDKVIFGRSIFPSMTIEGRGGCLRELGNHSLGDIFDKDATLQRSGFEIAKIEKSHVDYTKAADNLLHAPDFFWARRSIFYLYSQPLLVSEVFLFHE